MRHRLVLLLAGAVVLLAGCGSAAAEDHPAVSQPSTEPFLPAYLKMIQGESQPQDHCHHPSTLADLLVPCDEPRDRIEHELGHTADKENK